MKTEKKNMKDSEKKKRTAPTEGISHKNKSPMDTALSVVHSYSDDGIDTDPLGSWTGVPKDRYDRPIQDADDL